MFMSFQRFFLQIILLHKKTTEKINETMRRGFFPTIPSPNADWTQMECTTFAVLDTLTETHVATWAPEKPLILYRSVQDSYSMHWQQVWALLPDIGCNSKTRLAFMPCHTPPLLLCTVPTSALNMVRVLHADTGKPCDDVVPADIKYLTGGIAVHELMVAVSAKSTHLDHVVCLFTTDKDSTVWTALRVVDTGKFLKVRSARFMQGGRALVLATTRGLYGLELSAGTIWLIRADDKGLRDVEIDSVTGWIAIACGAEPCVLLDEFGCEYSNEFEFEYKHLDLCINTRPRATYPSILGFSHRFGLLGDVSWYLSRQRHIRRVHPAVSECYGARFELDGIRAAWMAAVARRIFKIS